MLASNRVVQNKQIVAEKGVAATNKAEQAKKDCLLNKLVSLISHFIENSYVIFAFEIKVTGGLDATCQKHFSLFKVNFAYKLITNYENY